MSDNNIYNILGKLDALKPQAETAKQTAERIYESVEAQGSVMEGVKSVEARLNEKYMGFKKTAAAVAKGGAENPAAVAASIGRKKYGKAAFQKAAAAGKKMGEGSGFDPEQPEGGGAGAGDITREARDGDTNFGSTVTRGSWVVYNGSKVKRFKTHTGAKAYAEKNGGKVASSEFYADKIHGKQGMAEERETLQTKKGTIYKGGKYGTEYDPSDEEKKTKAKHVPNKGQKGRPKKDKPAASTPPKGDIFGRTTGEVPKGKKGTKIKGKGNIDTVDEVIDIDTLNQLASHPMAGPIAAAGGAAIGAAVGGAVKKAGDWYKNRQEKKALAQQPKMAESRLTVGKALMESVNFKRMMDEANMTLDEMLECMNQDIKTYKATGDMSDRLRDFMHLHQHAKKQMEEAGPVPYEVPAVQRQAAGAPALTPQAVQQQDANRSMHPGMTKLDAPKPSVTQELDELAKLAGITDEGNAFTGKLKDTPPGGEFELGGKTFKDTSKLDEETCMECGMYESKCTCHEGNLFTKHLKDTPKGGEFEIDGKKYKDTSNLDEGTCPKCHADPCECPTESTTLEDIARLAGIAVEGKDYGDTTIAEPPTYDNTPDEEVQGEDVLLKGGDGEVAGGEKAMKPNKPTWKNADNPLAEDEFNPVDAMGRKLMKAYEAIKVTK